MIPRVPFFVLPPALQLTDSLYLANTFKDVVPAFKAIYGHTVRNDNMNNRVIIVVFSPAVRDSTAISRANVNRQLCIIDNFTCLLTEIRKNTALQRRSAFNLKYSSPFLYTWALSQVIPVSGYPVLTVVNRPLRDRCNMDVRYQANHRDFFTIKFYWIIDNQI